MAENKTSLGKELTKGIVKENPTLVMLLGMCPTLAVTTQAKNGIGMGLATTFVLLGSNIVVSLLRKVIPDKVRIPAFIVIIASFVTLIGFLLEGFLPDLYDSLGIYLTLITVNCIIFGRAEMFASKNNVFDSALDGIGMGIGFTFALFLMGSFREILGSGTWLGFHVLDKFIPGMGIFNLAPGGFFAFAVVMALVTYLAKDKSKIRKDFGCAGCAMEGLCSDEKKANREKGEVAC